MQKFVETCFTIAIGAMQVMFIGMSVMFMMEGAIVHLTWTAVAAATCDHLVRRRSSTIRVYAGWTYIPVPKESRDEIVPAGNDLLYCPPKQLC